MCGSPPDPPWSPQPPERCSPPRLRPLAAVAYTLSRSSDPPPLEVSAPPVAQERSIIAAVKMVPPRRVGGSGNEEDGEDSGES